MKKTTLSESSLSPDSWFSSGKSSFLLVFLFLLSGFNALWSQQISGNQNVCLGDQVTYTVQQVPGENYTWELDGGTILSASSGVNEITVLWSTAGNGEVHVSSQPGNTSDDFSVQVSNLPVPEISSAESILCTRPSKGEFETSLNCFKTCENNTNTYATPFHAGSTYTWVVTGALSYSANQHELTVMWGAEGVGTIQLTETNSGGCSTTITSCVEILEGPTALFATIPAASGNTLTVCLGQSIFFDDQSIDATNWFWDFGDGTTSYGQNPDHTYLAAGTYTVTLVVGNGPDPSNIGVKEIIKEQADIRINTDKLGSICNCTDTYQMTIIVEDEPVAPIECVSVVCAGDIQTYTSPANCNNFNWSVTGGTILSSDGNAVTVQWGDGQSGPGYLTLDVGNCPGYCSSPSVAQVSIIPNVASISGDQIVCNNSAHVYTMPALPGTTYSWTVNNTYGAILSGQGTNTIQVYWFTNNSVTTPVKVSYQNNVLGCGGTGELNVQVVPEFDIYGSTQVCAGNISVVSGFQTNDGSPVFCDWSVITPDGTLINDIQSNSIDFNTYNFNAGAGTYVVLAKPSSAVYCNLQATMSINVLNPPAAPTGILGNSPVCPGSSETYFAQSGILNPSFFWTVNGGSIVTNNGASIEVLWDAVGPYELSLVQSYANVSGCASEAFVRTIDSKLPFTSPAISGQATVCLGGVSEYSFVPNGADATYQWSISPASLGNIITPDDATDIDVVWADNNQQATTADVVLTTTVCGRSESSTFTVSLEGFAPLMSVASPICVKTETQFTVSDGNYFEWSFGDGSTSSLQNPTHEYATPGSYPVSLFVRNANNCETELSQIIDVKPLPIANISTPDRLHWCTGEDISVTMYAIEGSGSTYTYSWQPGSFSTANPVTVTTPGQYYAIVTNEFGCSKYSDTLIVTQDSCTGCQPEAHTVDFTFDLLAASCNEVSFTPTYSANVRVTGWDFRDYESSSNFSNLVSPTHAFSEAGYFLVRMFYRAPHVNGVPGDSSDCYIERLVFIPVVANFHHEFSCSGSTMSTKLYDQSGFFASGGIDSYTWLVDGNLASTDQNPVLNLSSGAHTISLTVEENGIGVICSTSEVIIVPAATVANMDFTAAVCPGESVQFTDLSLGDSINGWMWNFDTGVASSSAQNPIRVFNTPGNRSISLTVTSIYGCSSTVSGNLAVNSPENGTITANGPLTFCAGNSVTLTAPAGSSYLWSTGATTSSIVVTQTGNYDVEVTGLNGCTYTSSPVYVLVHATPVANITGDQEICQGFTAVLSGTPGMRTYTWSVDYTPIDGVYTVVQSGASSVLFASQAGNYQLTAENFNGCSSVSGNFTLTVNPTPVNPIVSVDPQMGTLCADTVYTLKVTNPQAGVTYEWSTGQSGTQILVNRAGIYTVQAITASGCKASSNIIRISPLPDVSQVMSGCYDFCKSELPVFVPGPAGYLSYNWYKLENGNYVLVSTTRDLKVTEGGTYVLEIKSSEGCVAMSDPLFIEVHPDPEIKINAVIDGSCAGATAILTALGADTYEWFAINNELNCTPSAFSLDILGLTNALAQNHELAVEFPTEIDLVNNSNYNVYLANLNPHISILSDVVWAIDDNSSTAFWWVYSQSDYNNYVELQLDMSGFLGFNFADIVAVNSFEVDPATVDMDGNSNQFILEVTLTNSSVIQIKGKAFEFVSSSLSRYLPINVGNCSNETAIGSGSEITVSPATTTTYTVIGTDAETGCTGTATYTVVVDTVLTSATIDCCTDMPICKGSSATIPVHFTGNGPWTFTYTNGTSTNTVTTSSNPYLLSVSPLMTTTYSLVSVQGSDNSTCTEVCGQATIGVNTCTPPPTTKGKKQADCSKNCFTTTVISVVDDGPGCKTVTLEISCDNTCGSALSNFTVSVPCGTITRKSNTLGHPMFSVNPDPNTGISGFKVDNIQDFCEEHTAQAFQVTYTICTDENSCSDDFCAPLVAYKAGTCVNYGMANNPNNLKSLTDAASTEAQVSLNAYPNPFDQSTLILLDVPADAELHMEVLDMLGKQLTTLYDGRIEAGNSSFRWDGTNEAGEAAPHGMYYVACHINGVIHYVKVMYSK